MRKEFPVLPLCRRRGLVERRRKPIRPFDTEKPSSRRHQIKDKWDSYECPATPPDKSGTHLNKAEQSRFDSGFTGLQICNLADSFMSSGTALNFKNTKNEPKESEYENHL
jgi:hypothetical protein